MKRVILILLFVTAFIVSKESFSMAPLFPDIFGNRSSIAKDTLLFLKIFNPAKDVENDSLAITQLEKALIIAENAGWEKGIMMANAELGMRFGKMGSDYTRASYLLKALPISVRIKNNFYTAFCLRYLGDSYFGLKDFRTAISHHYEALKFFKTIGDKKGFLLCLNNLGLDFYGQKNFKKAIEIFKQCESFGYPDENTIFTLINLGSAYRETDNFDKAMQYFNQYLLEEKRNEEGIAFVKKEIAYIFFYKKNYKEALKSAEEAIKICKSDFSSTEIEEEIHEILYQIYDVLHKPEESFRHFKRFRELKESNLLDMKGKQMESLKFYLENDHQKNSILLLNQEKRIMKISILGFSLFCILLTISIITLIKQNTEIKNQRREISKVKDELAKNNENLEKEVENRTIELKNTNEELTRKNNEIIEALFKGQTIERKRVAAELHDNLGGTLAAIKWKLEALNNSTFSEKEQQIYDGILSMMKTAYSEVRLISHNLLPAELEKRGLSGAIGKLVKDINQMGRLYIFLDTKEIEKISDPMIEFELYSICMELLSNILKHSQASEASIIFEKKESELILRVKDNGIGYPSSDQIDKTGSGLRNLHARVASIRGSLFLRNKHEVEIIIPHVIPLV